MINLPEAAADLRERGFERLRPAVIAENEVVVAFYESPGFGRVDGHTEEFDGETRAEYVYERRL